MNPKEQRTHRTITAALAARAADDETRLESVERQGTTLTAGLKTAEARLTAVEEAGAEALRLLTKLTADLGEYQRSADHAAGAFLAFKGATLKARLRWIAGRAWLIRRT